MRFSLFLGVLAYLFVSCTASTSAPVDDQAAIAATVQGFYKWYGTFSVEPANNIADGVEQNGADARFKAGALDAYLQKYLSNGFMSQSWADAERKYLQDCETKWKGVQVEGDVLEGLDIDRKYCAQDGEFGQYETVPTKSEITGDRAVTALMFAPGSPNIRAAPTVEMVKENGKWLIAGFKCPK